MNNEAKIVADSLYKDPSSMRWIYKIKTSTEHYLKGEGDTPEEAKADAVKKAKEIFNIIIKF